MTDTSEILPKEIGSVLRRRREELHLTLEEVVEKTKIRKSYILALEEENFHELPGKVYVVGFLRNYAGLLGLDIDPLLEALDDVPGPVKKNETTISEFRTQKSLAKSSRLKIWLWAIIVLVVLVAAGMYFIPMVFGGKSISIDAPDSSVSGYDSSQERSPGPTGAENDRLEASGKSLSSQSGQTEGGIPLAIPSGGGTLKLIVEGSGKFLISVDGGDASEYLAQPGLTLSWPVRETVDLDLNVDGEVLLQVDDQEYSVTGKRHLLLHTQKESKG